MLQVLPESRQTLFTALPSFIKPVILLKDVIKLIMHNFPVTNPCCLLQVRLEVVSRFSCSITFLGTEMRLTKLYSSGLVLVPFSQAMNLEGQDFFLTDLNRCKNCIRFKSSRTLSTGISEYNVPMAA